MGDTKHIRLTVRSASQIEIQDAIHRDFVPGVHSHKYPKGADRNSVTVEVVGDVDAGKLYDRLKKIRSSVEVEIEFEIEIESVIPAEIKRLEEDNKNLHRKLNDHESEIKSLNEVQKNLQRKIKELENYKGGTSVTSVAVQGSNNLIIIEGLQRGSWNDSSSSSAS